MSRYGWKYKGGGPFRQIAQLNYVFDQFQWNSQFKAELTECHLYVMQIGNVGSPNVPQQGGGGIYQVRVEMRGGYFNELSLCNRDFRTPSGSGREKRFEHYFKNLIEMTIWSMPLLAPVCRRRTVNSWLDTHTYNFEDSKCVCVYIVWLY